MCEGRESEVSTRESEEVEESEMSKFTKVAYSLPDELVKRIRAETKARSKELGVEYGVQTSVVRHALEVGLSRMERKRVKK